MNYYTKIKDKLIKEEIYSRVKDYTKDLNKVKTYYEVGKLLSKAGKKYGKNIIKQYSEKLVIDVGKKYNTSTFYKIRQFYEVFSNSKLEPMVPILNWSHYVQLISLKNINEIKYYIGVCKRNNLTKRELQAKIKSNEYNRLSSEVKDKFIKNEKLNITDLVPNPIVIKNSNLDKEYSEYALKGLVLSNIDSFLKSLGAGFSYIGNEYRIKVGSTYNYIDILLFNITFNCYVVIELKTTKLKKEHIGQITLYMNYIDKSIRRIDQDKTIGIIIVKKNNKYVIEYTSDNRIISREYLIN